MIYVLFDEDLNLFVFVHLNSAKEVVYMELYDSVYLAGRQYAKYYFKRGFDRYIASKAEMYLNEAYEKIRETSYIIARLDSKIYEASATYGVYLNANVSDWFYRVVKSYVSSYEHRYGEWKEC